MNSNKIEKTPLETVSGATGTPKSALVAGGGIGGLAAGIALQQAGWRVSIFEQAAEFKAIGAGLTIWPNAVKALYTLGLREDLEKMGVSEFAGGFFTEKGELLAKIAYADILNRYGAPILAVHRADLLAALLNKLGKDRLRLGAKLLDLSQDEKGVTANFSNGETARADLLIGADGIHSKVREKLFGSRPLNFSGYTAWRGVAPTPGKPFEAGETWGKGRRFGLVPLNGEAVYWFATDNRPANEPHDPTRHQEELLYLFDGWHFPVKELIATTPAENILRNDIYDLPPLEKWTVGRVTLLGDAAHAMTPNLGQGACQAIEDAVVLAGCLAQSAQVPNALQRYEGLRRGRTTRITRQARQVGMVGQWRNPALVWLRNRLARWLLPRLQDRQLAPILNYEADRVAKIH
jgi:2-polyprenyl-6-methoxyphenol hydroxylase-like FAD-dependent oxidoreductase